MGNKRFVENPLLKQIITVILSLSLIGCGAPTYHVGMKEVPAEVVGVNRAEGNTSKGFSKTEVQLMKAGVQIIQLGQDRMLVLPADRFFYRHSNHLNESYQTTLDLLATYINNCSSEVTKVAGYTDNIGSSLRNVALSRQQAQVIVKYLWKQSLNTSMIYAIGYGGLYPIASDRSAWGRKQNRRIQITFRCLADNQF